MYQSNDLLLVVTVSVLVSLMLVKLSGFLPTTFDEIDSSGTRGAARSMGH